MTIILIIGVITNLYLVWITINAFKQAKKSEKECEEIQKILNGKN